MEYIKVPEVNLRKFPESPAPYYGVTRNQNWLANMEAKRKGKN